MYDKPSKIQEVVATALAPPPRLSPEEMSKLGYQLLWYLESVLSLSTCASVGEPLPKQTLELARVQVREPGCSRRQ